MTESVIDALVVTLGLRDDAFADGIKNATSSLTGFATKVAGLAIGFQGLEAGIRYFEDLHQRLAGLYFTSRNLGIMGTELSRLGEFAQLFGGKVEDATGSVQGLQAAVFNLRFKGQMSESLAMLQRFGVAYLNANGTMRDPEAIARDAAVAIERQARVSNLTPSDRYQLALNFGLQGGLASAAAQGTAGFDEQLARARKDQAGLTESTLRGQATLNRDITSRRAQRDAEQSQALNALLPALEQVNEVLQDLAAKAIPGLVAGINISTTVFKHLGTAATSAAKALEKIKTSTTLAPTRPGEKPVNIYSPFSYTWRLGKQIDEHIAETLDHFLSGGANTPQPISQPHGVAHGNISRSPPVIPPRAPVTPLAPRPSTDAGSKPTAMNGGPETHITFENVTINSRSQDGGALARDFENRIQRGYLVSNADPGMVS
jgi:hypothetical protein